MQTTTIPEFSPQVDKNEAKEVVVGWVRQFMRVTLTDGRSFVGRFVCVDNLKNVVLNDTNEYRKTGEGNSTKMST
jgi:small nuclear ribonucleoprotein (snRNP)-like protein